jgi:hypothetical protein
MMRHFRRVNSWLPCMGAALFHALFNAQVMGPVIHTEYNLRVLRIALLWSLRP